MPSVFTKRFILLLAVLSHTVFAYSQVSRDFCQTTAKPLRPLSLTEGTWLSRNAGTIPIALHLITDEQGGGNEMTPAKFQQFLDSINLLLEPIELQLELCIVNEIPDEDNLNPPIDFSGLLIDAYHESGYVNVFMPNTVGGNDAAGYATRIGGVFTDDDHLFILGQGATYGLLAHEIGHLFGLFHTFETSFGEELVDGSNCFEAGDLLCDTEADHGIQRADVDSLTCTWLYPNSVFDANNDPYNPSTTNIMSYSRLDCINTFSWLQLQTMRVTYALNADYLESCQPTSATDPERLEATVQLKLYPNPAQGFLQLELDRAQEALVLMLYNALGKLVLVEKQVGQRAKLCLDVAHLPPGQYFLKLSNANFVSIKKVQLK